MCGRFTLTVDPEELRDRFDLVSVPDLEPRYNIAPTQEIVVVRSTGTANEMAVLRWGLVPSWADSAEGPPLINARAESIFRKPSFKESVERRRCIIPADGYYEWKKVSGFKQPYHIRMQGRGLFAMAGLWDRWSNPSGGALESCAIITTEANSLSREVHNRMPVILKADHWQEWLNGGNGAAAVKPLLAPFPSELMEMEPVSPTVNRVTTDSAECLRPAETNFELEL